LHANPNAIEVCFKDGTSSGVIEIEYPVGHWKRRSEGLPQLLKKFERALALRFAPPRQASIKSLCLDHERLTRTPVDEFTDLFAV
jgi:2-methylcitrate dehydratase PrpD